MSLGDEKEGSLYLPELLLGRKVQTTLTEVPPGAGEPKTPCPSLSSTESRHVISQMCSRLTTGTGETVAAWEIIIPVLYGQLFEF